MFLKLGNFVKTFVKLSLISNVKGMQPRIFDYVQSSRF